MRWHRKSIASDQTISSWRARFAVLSRRLAESSETEDGWYWQVQCRVIHFLLRRYDCDDRGRVLATKVVRSGANSADDPRMVVAFKSSNSFMQAEPVGKSPRDGGIVRPVLREIADFNRERYDMWRRDREVEWIVHNNELQSSRAARLALGWYDE